MNILFICFPFTVELQLNIIYNILFSLEVTGVHYIFLKTFLNIKIINLQFVLTQTSFRSTHLRLLDGLSLIHSLID